jgi:hypothetical protein
MNQRYYRGQLMNGRKIYQVPYKRGDNPDLVIMLPGFSVAEMCEGDTVVFSDNSSTLYVNSCPICGVNYLDRKLNWQQTCSDYCAEVKQYQEKYR